MKYPKAFSLVEMLVVLCIVGVIFAISFPTIANILEASQCLLLKSQLIRAIHFAQQEAQVRGLPIALTRKSNEWKEGVMIFINEKEDGRREDQRQSVTEMSFTTIQGHLKWRAFPKYRDYLLFSSSELANSDNGTFWYCNTSNTPIWAVMISKSGRVRVLDKKEELNCCHCERH